MGLKITCPYKNSEHWALLDVIQFFYCFFQSSHCDWFIVFCSKTFEFYSVTWIVERRALSSSGRTQFFGTASCSSMMKLSGNLVNSCVVNDYIDVSGIFFIILVVNKTEFRWKDEGEPVWNIPYHVFNFFPSHLGDMQVTHGVLLFLSLSRSFSLSIFS